MARNPENMIKARIAETIVEEMYRSIGCQVYRFGYESVLQNLVQTGNRIDRNEVGEVVAHMPDFLIIREQQPHFIEVKFRKDGKFFPKELKSWSEGRILLVFPFHPYFRISRVEEFMKTGKLYDLEKDRYFSVEKRVLDRFIPLVRKYLSEE